MKREKVDVVGERREGSENDAEGGRSESERAEERREPENPPRRENGE